MTSQRGIFVYRRIRRALRLLRYCEDNVPALMASSGEHLATLRAFVDREGRVCDVKPGDVIEVTPEVVARMGSTPLAPAGMTLADVYRAARGDPEVAARNARRAREGQPPPPSAE